VCHLNVTGNEVSAIINARTPACSIFGRLRRGRRSLASRDKVRPRSGREGALGHACTASQV
jgi:hypothetical protein